MYKNKTHQQNIAMRKETINARRIGMAPRLVSACGRMNTCYNHSGGGVENFAISDPSALALAKLHLIRFAAPKL